MSDLGTIGIAIEVRGRDALRQIENDMANVERSTKSASQSMAVFERAGLKTAQTFRYMSSETKAWLRDQDRILSIKRESEKIAARQAQAEAKVAQEIAKQRQAAEAAAAANAKRFQSQLNANLGVGGVGNSAAASAAAMEQEIQRLRMKYDEVYASSQIYQRSLEELNRAHMLGVTSTRQHEAAVEALNAEYQSFQAGTAGVGNRFAQNTAQMAGGLNNFGVITQQVGYQVGDFIVQVQSGTNAFVALGQQATQLVGFLPLLAESLGIAATRLVAISAVLSIVIPLITAFGAAWLRTRQEADEAAQSVDYLGQKLKALDSSLKDWATTKEAAAAGMSLDEFISVQGVEQSIENLRLYREEIRTWGYAVKQALLSTFFMDEDMEAVVAALEDKIKQAEDREAQVRQRMAESYAEETRALEYNFELAKAKVAFGEDSLQVKALEVQRERELYEATLRREGLNAEMISQLMKIYDENARIVKGAEEWRNRIDTVKSLLESINGMRLYVGLQIDTAVNNLPDWAKGVWDKANEIAWQGNLRGNETAMAGAPRAPAGIGGIDWGAPPAAKKGGGADPIERLRNEYQRLAEAFDPLLAAQNEYNADLEMLNEALGKGVINAQEYETALNNIKTKLAEARDPLNEFKQGLEDALNPEKNYMKGLRSLQDALSDFLFNPFEQGIKGMVLSFARALQRMLADIIAADIMKRLLNGPLGASGSIGSFFMNILGSANGNAFSNGNVMAFANGGIVNSPTLFPMNGNKTGLMGEAGPEAILPLKRGANGKLGVETSGEKVNINTKVINVLDPSIVGDYLKTSEGERLIMNVMRKTGNARI